jgi:hypothetical protein
MSAGDLWAEGGDVKDKKQESAAAAGRGGGGSPVYGLGFIGAVAWNWQQAGPAPRDRAMAVLKSTVWPAFLVYAAFRALERSTADL